MFRLVEYDQYVWVWQVYLQMVNETNSERWNSVNMFVNVISLLAIYLTNRKRGALSICFSINQVNHRLTNLFKNNLELKIYNNKTQHCRYYRSITNGPIVAQPIRALDCNLQYVYTNEE